MLPHLSPLRTHSASQTPSAHARTRNVPPSRSRSVSFHRALALAHINQGVDDVFEAATRASMLMREGVPAHVPSAHERRGSRARNVEGTKSGCCVIC